MRTQYQIRVKKKIGGKMASWQLANISQFKNSIFKFPINFLWMKIAVVALAQKFTEIWRYCKLDMHICRTAGFIMTALQCRESISNFHLPRQIPGVNFSQPAEGKWKTKWVCPRQLISNVYKR
jgi:hypothetical protein